MPRSAVPINSELGGSGSSDGVSSAFDGLAIVGRMLPTAIPVMQTDIVITIRLHESTFTTGLAMTSHPGSGGSCNWKATRKRNPPPA